jgi:hypothetical protein
MLRCKQTNKQTNKQTKLRCEIVHIVARSLDVSIGSASPVQKKKRLLIKKKIGAGETSGF